MKIENEWLDAEMMQISKENKSFKVSKRKDTLLFMQMIMMLSFIFFYPQVAEASPKLHNKAEKVVGGGRAFRCPKCEDYQWHCTQNADFLGNYYCKTCRTKLN